MYLDRYSFSDNQWRKGNGLSRCVDCVCDGPGWACDDCAKTFPDENALRMHKRTHQARDFPCPGCNKLYRGLTDTAMHFESGNCSSCRGVENARRAAYQLCMQQPGGANFLTNPLMITDGGGAGGGYTDEGPNYKCNHCHKQFKFLSSLMQHQQTSACLHASSQQINLRIGNGPAVQEFKFFHGTTWTKACQIRDNGFIPSSGGCLGFGITSSLVYYTRIRDCKNICFTGTIALAFIESITSVIFELSTSALSPSASRRLYY